MYDVVIIGKGPAGISAALYTKRANLNTLVIGKDNGWLIKADKIENYYGFTEPVSGKTLVENGIEQAIKLGVEVVDGEVISIEYDGNYTVKTAENEYSSKAILLATGASRKSSKIEGLSEFEGRGVSYCAVCDAFFYRGKAVCVLGSGAYAVSEAREIMAVASSVTIVTNGEELAVDAPDGVAVEKKKIAKLSGGELLEKIVFDDGSDINTSGLFVAIGVAGSDEFARKLGVLSQNGKIVVDEKQATNLAGFYAAGDCTGGVLQISTAVGEGAKAGLEIIDYVRHGK